MDFLVPTDAPLQLAPIHPSAQESGGEEGSLFPAEYLPGSPLCFEETSRLHSPVAGVPPGLPAAGTAVQESVQSV